jgi:hypothetical protein
MWLGLLEVQLLLAQVVPRENQKKNILDVRVAELLSG